MNEVLYEFISSEIYRKQQTVQIAINDYGKSRILAEEITHYSPDGQSALEMVLIAMKSWGMVPKDFKSEYDDQIKFLEPELQPDFVWS